MSFTFDNLSQVHDCTMTQYSPFPIHVQSFLYSGKTVILADRNGVDVDMRGDVFRKVMETTERMMKEKHFRYATKGSFADQSKATPKRPRLRKKTTRLPTMISDIGAIAPEVLDSSETETDEDFEPISTNPLRPSLKLLEFLRRDSHLKPKSLVSAERLPPVRTSTRLRKKVPRLPLKNIKPSLRRFFNDVNISNLRKPKTAHKEMRHSLNLKFLKPDSSLSLTSFK